jgi:hypothetical protein
MGKHSINPPYPITLIAVTKPARRSVKAPRSAPRAGVAFRPRPRTVPEQSDLIELGADTSRCDAVDGAVDVTV